MSLLEKLPAQEKAKVYFIHFNPTNPLLQNIPPAQKEILEKGYKLAEEGLILPL